jgi:glycosyltransferase involved in cell wall biosynthesis
MTQTSISCVVPTLNSAQTLDATLHSLRAQREVTAEIIVSDSGSTDGTLDICRRWEANVRHTPPGNMYRAINAGLKDCDTEWLAYVNSDDCIYPDSYELLTSFGEESGADVVYGNCDYIDGQGRFVYSFAAARAHQLMPLFRLRRMGFAQTSAIFRRRCYERLGGFDESFVYRGDADFYIRALANGMKFACLDGPPVSCFRLHGNQFSNRGLELTEIEAGRIFCRPEMSPEVSDWLVLAQWRGRNLPHYLIRILRESLLSRRTRFPRSIEPYTHR